LIINRGVSIGSNKKLLSHLSILQMLKNRRFLPTRHCMVQMDWWCL